MPQFSRTGADIHYDREGEGVPLLLIAGTASDGASWGPLLPLFDRYELIRIDNRGSGQTRFDGDISVADMVDDCAALLDHLGIRSAAVVGHSLGGTIGLHLAARHPERVAALVTLTAGWIGFKERVLFGDMAAIYESPLPPQPWFRLLYQFLFSERFFADEAAVAAAAEASANYPHRQSPENFRRQVAAIGPGRVRPVDVGRIACPVLAVSAGHDLLVSPESVLAAHRGIPLLETADIADAGHSIHWEAPQAVARMITEFLGRQLPAR